MQKVEKKPTGKLSDASSILRAVKIVLGQDKLGSLYAAALDALEKFRVVATSIASEAGEDTDYDSQYFNLLQKILTSRQVIKQKNFESSLWSAMDNLKSGIEPSILSLEHSTFSPEQQNKWQEVQKYFPVLKKYADRFHTAIVGIQEIEGRTQATTDAEKAKEIDPETASSTPQTDGSAYTQLATLFTQIVQDMTASKAKAQGLQNASALLPWFDKAMDTIQKVYQNALTHPSDVATYVGKLNAIKTKLDAGKKKWNI